MVGGSKPHLRSAFQLICVSLSKADAKLLLYNISTKYFRHFFCTFCNFFAKSLIFKHAVEHKKVHSIKSSGKLHLIIIYKGNTKYAESSSGTSNLLKTRWIK